MSEATSVIMYVGESYYKLHEIISEALQQGVHKRIPSTSIPEGIVPWESKIFLAHNRAIVKTTIGTLSELAYELYERDLLSFEQWHDMVDLNEPFWTGEELHAEDFVPEQMLTITTHLSMLLDEERGELEKKYGLVYMPGIFGFAYIENIHYIAKPGETSLPVEYSHMSDIIEAVHVKKVEEADESLEEYDESF